MSHDHWNTEKPALRGASSAERGEPPTLERGKLV